MDIMVLYLLSKCSYLYLILKQFMVLLCLMHQFSSCLCFYSGQTGSGKTFTMLGKISLMAFMKFKEQIYKKQKVIHSPLVLGPSEMDNFTDDLRGVIPRSFEYLFFLINREVERVSGNVFHRCKDASNPHYFVFLINLLLLFFNSRTSPRVSFANVHSLKYTMNKSMTSWIQPPPAFFFGKTLRKACLLKEPWRSL